MSIDYNNQEIQDIQTAVHTMLDRVVTRVNKRGLFNISRIHPCGSMAEQTAAWKYDKETNERYTEFDFLAVLHGDPRHNRACGGCVEISIPPVGLETVWTIFEKDIADFINNESSKEKFDSLFWRELNSCLVCLCNCFSMTHRLYDEGEIISFKVSTAKSSSDAKHGCDKCVVEMSTGILRINDSISIGRARETLVERAIKCSLMFIWTSKTNKLSVQGPSLDEVANSITTLAIHVDFLPAFELSKSQPDGNAHKHFCFLVPKRCEVCNWREYNEKWRKSWSIAEIKYIVNDMSVKHRKCFKILKYFLSSVDEAGIISGYHVKSTVLQHSQVCSDSSGGYVDCVLKILAELKRACETKTLKIFQSGVDILSAMDRWTAELNVDLLQRVIERVCSVSKSDSFISLVNDAKLPPICSTID